MTIRRPPWGRRYPWPLTSCPSRFPALFNKDLLATLHLLVALAKRFQPNLPLPTDVQVEVITLEVRAGLGGWVAHCVERAPWVHLTTPWIGGALGEGEEPSVL